MKYTNNLKLGLSASLGSLGTEGMNPNKLKAKLINRIEVISHNMGVPLVSRICFSTKSSSQPKQVKPVKPTRKTSLKGSNKAVKIRNRSKLSEPSAKAKGTKVSGEITANLSVIHKVFATSLQGVFTLEEIENFFDLTILAHNKLVVTTGVKQATKTWKTITSYSNMLLEGRDPGELHRVSVGRVDRWPRILGHLRPIRSKLENSRLSNAQATELRRLMLTLFKVNKVCYDFVDLDVSGLDQKFKIPLEVEKKFIKFLNDRVETVDNLDCLGCLPFLSPAHGPNFQPKLETVDAEAYALVNSPLWRHFEEFCVLTDQEFLAQYVLLRSEEYLNSNPSPTDEIYLRRLIAIADSGNKSRIIAVCDFFTQSLLSGLESVVLEEIQKEFGPHSAFYSHSEGFNIIKDQDESVHKELVSLDATSWTDNLPSRLQFLYLKHKFGHQLASAWRGLAVDCNWNLGRTEQTVRYGKGQGMGTKGSFIIASATNIAFIDMLLADHYGDGVTHNQFYLTVGDDMVIQDPDMVCHQSFEDIGVPINLSKSKVPGLPNTYSEFVSRNLCNVQDYSVISPRLATKARRQVFYSRTFLSHLNERYDTKFTMDQVLDFIEVKESEKGKLLFLNDLFSLAVEYDNPEVIHDFYATEEFMKIDLVPVMVSMIDIIVKSFKKWVESTDFRKSLINNERLRIFKSRYELSSARDFWEFCFTEKLSAKEIELLVLTDRFHSISQKQYDIGIVSSYEEFLNDKIQLTSVLRSDVSTLLALILKIEKQTLGTQMRLETLSSRLSEETSFHKSNLHLFKFLNKGFNHSFQLEIDSIPNEKFLKALQLDRLREILMILHKTEFQLQLVDLIQGVDSTPGGTITPVS